ncbi:MAG TPA: C40 family peptidase [Gemmatimonadaceae bacterium]|nr:C40 family peptidase [Gemmatimonadaceae bacterium]
MHQHNVRRTLIPRPWRGVIVVVALVGAASARPAAAQAPIPMLQGMSASAGSLRDSIVALTRAQIGTRYRHGGASPQRGFDCSGLIQYVMARFSMVVPRTAKAQASVGVPVERDTSLLRPGDLLTFASTDRASISHIGIYVGDGRFVHASSVAGRVIESPLNRAPAPRIKIWRGVARIPMLADAQPVEFLATPER